jgi:hypothetical protein
VLRKPHSALAQQRRTGGRDERFEMIGFFPLNFQINLLRNLISVAVLLQAPLWAERRTLMIIQPFMHLVTEDGDVEIREQDLAAIDRKYLRKWGIRRKELRRCFAEAMEMMRGATQKDWAKGRPIAAQHLDGTWEVVGPVGYNQHTHPLMKEPPGKA